MTATINVYHRTDSGRMTDFHLGSAEWEKVYSYDTDRTHLEEVWRDNNRVDGGTHEVVNWHPVRSMCVGDVVVVEADGGTTASIARMVGWSDYEEFLTKEDA